MVGIGNIILFSLSPRVGLGKAVPSCLRAAPSCFHAQPAPELDAGSLAEDKEGSGWVFSSPSSSSSLLSHGDAPEVGLHGGDDRRWDSGHCAQIQRPLGPIRGLLIAQSARRRRAANADHLVTTDVGAGCSAPAHGASALGCWASPGAHAPASFGTVAGRTGPIPSCACYRRPMTTTATVCGHGGMVWQLDPVNCRSDLVSLGHRAASTLIRRLAAEAGSVGSGWQSRHQQWAIVRRATVLHVWQGQVWLREVFGQKGWRLTQLCSYWEHRCPFGGASVGRQDGTATTVVASKGGPAL